MNWVCSLPSRRATSTGENNRWQTAVQGGWCCERQLRRVQKPRAGQELPSPWYPFVPEPIHSHFALTRENNLPPAQFHHLGFHAQSTGLG